MNLGKKNRNSIMRIKFFNFSLIILFLTFLNSNYCLANNNEALFGNDDSKIIVKVFSSLTCPHCANFHKKIFEELRKDYPIIVKFEHHGFPLDLAALNAEKLLNCFQNKSKKISFLNEIYEKQDTWANGSDINKINSNLIKIAKKHGLNNDMINNCLSDTEIEDKILNKRIMAQKKYSIDSTPSIFINEKKYEGKYIYEDFKKIIEKEIK